MRPILALALLSLAGPANAQGYGVPATPERGSVADGVNKCINTGVATQCTLLGVAPSYLENAMMTPTCDDGYETVLTARGYMCAKDLKPTK